MKSLRTFICFFLKINSGLGLLSIRKVLAVWVVYGPGNWVDVGCLLSWFLRRFMVYSDPCFVHSLNLIDCTVWGIGAFQRKLFNQLFVSHTCILWFLKITQQEAFSVIQIWSFSFVVPIFFKRHSLFRFISLMDGKELMMHSCFILIFFFFIVELMHLGF